MRLPSSGMTKLLFAAMALALSQGSYAAETVGRVVIVARITGKGC